MHKNHTPWDRRRVTYSGYTFLLRMGKMAISGGAENSSLYPHPQEVPQSVPINEKIRDVCSLLVKTYTSAQPFNANYSTSQIIKKEKIKTIIFHIQRS